MPNIAVVTRIKRDLNYGSYCIKTHTSHLSAGSHSFHFWWVWTVELLLAHFFVSPVLTTKLSCLFWSLWQKWSIAWAKKRFLRVERWLPDPEGRIHPLRCNRDQNCCCGGFVTSSWIALVDLPSMSVPALLCEWVLFPSMAWGGSTLPSITNVPPDLSRAIQTVRSGAGLHDGTTLKCCGSTLVVASIQVQPVIYLG